MKLFNGNARDPEATYVPAENYLRVGKWLQDLVNRGVSLAGLEVRVQKGSLQLGNETGSYGLHQWDG